jgi:hypothetical protein
MGHAPAANERARNATEGRVAIDKEYKRVFTGFWHSIYMY